jgi:hypothetical protein
MHSQVQNERLIVIKGFEFCTLFYGPLFQITLQLAPANMSNMCKVPDTPHRFGFVTPGISVSFLYVTKCISPCYISKLKVEDAHGL